MYQFNQETWHKTKVQKTALNVILFEDEVSDEVLSSKEMYYQIKGIRLLTKQDLRRVIKMKNLLQWSGGVLK